MTASPPEPYVESWFHVAFDFAKANVLKGTMDAAFKTVVDDWVGRFTKLPGSDDWQGRHYESFRDERKLEENRYVDLTWAFYYQKQGLDAAIEAAQAAKTDVSSSGTPGTSGGSNTASNSA